jgi:hypothetical protein
VRPVGRWWLAALVALFALGRGAATAAGQISPGPLAKAHAKLEGSLQCTACHGSGGRTAMTAQCLDCHKDVAWLSSRGLGLHGREGKSACATCHPDHAGVDFKLISWADGDSTRFDHGRTGWPLEGDHRTTKCADCHKAELRRSPAAAQSRRKGPSVGWLGLDRACVSCHEDAHRGALTQKCLDCHDIRDWKPAPRFDHGRTDYPLTGKHVDVTCDKCHLAAKVATQRTAAGQPIPVYKPLPHVECSSCHADPHGGDLGPKCGTCHETSSFGKVSRSAFDHDRTKYPLRGKHAAVACAQCHQPGSPTGKRPPFATCTSCHADPHAGTATLGGRPADCASCHGVAGFVPATFTVAQHRQSRYPLEGKHQQVRCSACHVKNPTGVPRAKVGTAGTLLRPAFARCRDCHGDDHGGQLTGRRATDDCSACHVLADWTPSTFGVASHASLRLPLEGRHQAITCAACHGATRKGLPPLPPPASLGRAGVALKLREVECSACHLDPHDGRFAARGPRPQSAGCVACHDTRQFRPSTIDVAAHGAYDFKLEGAHRAVPCAACHDEMKRPAAKSSLVAAGPRGAAMPFTRATRTCEGCHTNPHGTQFAHRAAATCESCHGVDAFQPASRFDHDRETPFALKGAHEKVPCASCHTQTADLGGRRTVIYAPLSGKCETCHGAARKAS